MKMTGTIHASAVTIGPHGVLIRGASGSGKSSLVLGLLDRDPGTTRLVADDRVSLAVEGGRLVAFAPDILRGKLEVRGLGIADVAHALRAAIDLVVDLLPPDQCPRLPLDGDGEAEIGGVILPRLKLPIGAVDGPTRVRFAVQHMAGTITA